MRRRKGELLLTNFTYAMCVLFTAVSIEQLNEIDLKCETGNQGGQITIIEGWTFHPSNNEASVHSIPKNQVSTKYSMHTNTLTVYNLSVSDEGVYVCNFSLNNGPLMEALGGGVIILGEWFIFMCCECGMYVCVCVYMCCACTTYTHNMSTHTHTHTHTHIHTTHMHKQTSACSYTCTGNATLPAKGLSLLSMVIIDHRCIVHASVDQLVECVCLVSSMLWVQVPPEQLFFHCEKRCSGLLSCHTLI